ncbi:DNA helicase, partial [Tanacetum coccineum]
GVFYPTYRAACEALGLLGDDKEWETALEEACVFANSEQLSHGGTGKTFLWKTIISSLRSQGKIVLAVAYSGIASLLLPSGRTAHSRFKLPLELMEESLSRITKNTQLGKLLADTNLIVWDEAPINDRRCFRALDKSLRDIVNKPFSLFGGKSILLGGDFRQTLPIKKGASKIEIIASCLNLHYGHLLSGDGKIGHPAEKDPENTSWIDIPATYCLPPNEQDIINFKVLDMVPGESTSYMSQDEATPTGNDEAEIEMLYPVEHLNTLKLPGFPPHHLEL